MTNLIANGLYNMPAKGGFGILAVHVKDGMARAMVHFSGEGWEPHPNSQEWKPLTEDTAAQLEGWGLCDEQRLTDRPH